MGQLYLARMRGLEGFERLVVLKRLKPDVATRDENVKMFLDEVRVLASVQHANVVHIYDVGATKDGSFYYAMEFLVGQDLRRIMSRAKEEEKPLPLPQAVNIACSVLAGLQHVHQRTSPDGSPLKIVHRDVSPANVFVTYDGGVKLIDFGIAKTARRTTETAHGAMKGKFRYMSPEQCRADPVDARSDVFSLGIVLWEMTTARALYKTASDLKTLFAIVEVDAPRPSTFVPDYPPELEAIVMKALARRLEDRWASAKEMQRALEDFALERRWPQTANSLAEVMEERFATEIAELHGAQAAGQDLADFVVRQLDEPAGQPTGGSLASAGIVKETPTSTPWLRASRSGLTPAGAEIPAGSKATPVVAATPSLVPPPLPQRTPPVPLERPQRWLDRWRLVFFGGVLVLGLLALAAVVMLVNRPTVVTAPVPPPEAATAGPSAPPSVIAPKEAAPPASQVIAEPTHEVEKGPRRAPGAVPAKKATSSISAPPPPPPFPTPSGTWDKDSPLPPP